LRYVLKYTAVKKNNKLNIEFRVWFYAGNEKLLGKGRVELLERIERTGSINSASKEMKMSYRQAWQMVKEMNERAKQPLVEIQKGGKSGGGAQITKAGQNAIKVFRTLEKKVNTYLLKEASKIKL
jgi:molybdate transport system regulatory protein